MPDEIFPARVKFKRRTTAQWALSNPVLLAGEPGIEVLTDGTEKIKYGDGVKTWAQLNYGAAAGGGSPSLWLTGAGAPANSLGKPGDFYLRSSNGDIYGPKTDVWGSVAGNLASTVTIGTVSTAAPGAPAMVSNSGTAMDPVLDFVLPRGDAALLSNAAPAALAVSAAPGSSIDAARADHVHQRPTAADIGAATAVQGAKADSAVQPGALAPVATSGAYSDLSGRPSLGSAAARDAGTGANNVLLLDGSGQVPSIVLPSFVDDVLEFANVAAFPATGETGKLYISLATNRQYRWSGSIYVEINPSPGSSDAVPEGSVNLYFTNARAATAAPVQSVAGKIGNVTLTKNDVGLSNVDNVSDANKPISSATQAALDGKVNANDSRLTDAREWSASTITQAEAETGTATTRRAFTAQRVFQAAAAWWAGYRSTIGDALATAASAAAARTTLGLGSAATANTTDFATAAQGTNARTPTAHKNSHATGGSDALSPGDIGAAAAVHGHAISDVSGLQVALDEKASIALAAGLAIALG